MVLDEVQMQHHHQHLHDNLSKNDRKGSWMWDVSKRLGDKLQLIRVHLRLYNDMVRIPLLEILIVISSCSKNSSIQEVLHTL